MPYGPNKLKLNSGDLAGTYSAIKAAFKNGAFLDDEILDLGGGEIAGNKWLIEDAAAHLADQEALCKAVDEAMMKFLTGQRELNNRRRQWIDKKLSQIP